MAGPGEVFPLFGWAIRSGQFRVLEVILAGTIFIAISKIAANETYGGNMLPKAIDYFCHLAVAPGFLGRIEKGDKAFAASEFFTKMRWLSGVNDDIYDPTNTDMLRVAFTSEFGRGKLADLVALLSGRNFETHQYEDNIAESSFGRLKQGILQFISQTHFDEQKSNALDQAAPLQGLQLPEEFLELRRQMEARLGKRGRREYVQVLRLLETFSLPEVAAAVRQALRFPAIAFDAVKHLLLCAIEWRPLKLDLENYPHLPIAEVALTRAADS